MPALIVADLQTAGRGRGSHRWWTGPGGIACSILLDGRSMGLTRAQGPILSLATALAVVDTVDPLLLSYTVGLHWPNDVFVAGRKLAGILVEVLATGECVIGIGLNANNTVDDAPAELRSVVATLRDLTGSPHDPTSILVALLRQLERHLRRAAVAPEEIGVRADALCLQKGSPLVLASGETTVTGRCQGIAPDGALVLDTPQGAQRFFSGTLRNGSAPSA
jgi:BirA family biotin operon repressor/biotin-[acetyl-CoA-carboxylase] ligase